MPDLQAIATTLHQHAKPDMTPKEVIAAVRQHHPAATKKAIVRAAFYALTNSGTGDADEGRHLHAFALSERMAGEDEDAPLPRKRRRTERKEQEDQCRA